MKRTYTELSKLKTFEERFEYLKFGREVGVTTFGYDRIFNQKFYSSYEWKKIRDHVISRDNGCDLGCSDRIIIGERFVIHHLNIITLDDINRRTEILLDPEYLITTTHLTHNAIHYGDANLLVKDPIERTPNDTCPWKF